MNSGKFDVLIKNWVEFECVGVKSSGEGVIEFVVVLEKIKGCKWLKIRKMCNVNKLNWVEIKNFRVREKS